MLLIKKPIPEMTAWYRFEYEEKLKKGCIHFLLSIDDVTDRKAELLEKMLLRLEFTIRNNLKFRDRSFHIKVDYVYDKRTFEYYSGKY
jgi:hypothetical protein